MSKVFMDVNVSKFSGLDGVVKPHHTVIKDEVDRVTPFLPEGTKLIGYKMLNDYALQSHYLVELENDFFIEDVRLLIHYNRELITDAGRDSKLGKKIHQFALITKIEVISERGL